MKHYIVFTHGILRSEGRDPNHHDYSVNSEGIFTFHIKQDFITIFEYHDNKLIRRINSGAFAIANQPISIDEIVRHSEVEYFLLEAFS